MRIGIFFVSPCDLRGQIILDSMWLIQVDSLPWNLLKNVRLGQIQNGIGLLFRHTFEIVQKAL